MDRFGFSWIGVVFLAVFFLPDMICTAKMQTAYSPESTTMRFAGMERLGIILVCAAAITCAPLQPSTWNPRCWLLIGAAAIGVAYLIWWFRKVAKKRTEKNETFSGGVPLPGALAATCAFLLLGFYAQDLLLLVCTLFFAIGDIGVRREQKQVEMSREEE